MKKKINKKLSLVKQTVTNLNEKGMNNAKGGFVPTWMENDFNESVAWYVGSRNTCASCDC
jgi:hypothetical protein